jgi:hypothetical protein
MHKWCFMRDLTASGKSAHPSGDLSPEREPVRQACDKRQYEVYELVRKVVIWRGDFLEMIHSSFSSGQVSPLPFLHFWASALDALPVIIFIFCKRDNFYHSTDSFFSSC